MKKRKTFRKNELFKKRKKNRTKRRTKKRTKRRTKNKKSLRYKSNKRKQNKQSGGAYVLLNSPVWMGGIPDHLLHKISGEFTDEDLTAFSGKIGEIRFQKVYLIFSTIEDKFHPIIVITGEDGSIDMDNITYSFETDGILELKISEYKGRTGIKIKALAYIGRFAESSVIHGSDFENKLADGSFLNPQNNETYHLLTNNCQTYADNAFQYLKEKQLRAEQLNTILRKENEIETKINIWLKEIPIGGKSPRRYDNNDIVKFAIIEDLGEEIADEIYRQYVDTKASLYSEVSLDSSVELQGPVSTHKSFCPAIRSGGNTMLDIDLFTLPFGRSFGGGTGRSLARAGSRCWNCMSTLGDYSPDLDVASM